MSSNGIDKIAATFARAREEGRAALMPYLMAGYPTIEQSLEIGKAYVRGGADLIEVGIPFSDPLADGPVIHAAGTAALDSGVTITDALQVAKDLAQEIPVVVMCYSNPIYAYGLEQFVTTLAEDGVSGLIIPDMPFEEATELFEACERSEIAFVPLVAPTTTDERMQAIGKRAQGFLYTVSLTGTTGERSRVGSELPAVIARAKAATTVPVAVGFGISTPQDATEVAKDGADGVIIGSRLVRAAGESPTPAANIETLVRQFTEALKPGP